MKKIILSITILLIVSIVFSLFKNSVFAFVDEIIASNKYITLLENDSFIISHQSKMTELPKEDKDEVIEAFINAGFKKIATDKLDGALYETVVFARLNTVATVQESEESITITFTELEMEARSIFATPEDKESDEIIMAQVGVARADEVDNPMIGMCYVYKLSDGSAMIIDGGMFNDKCADNLYSTLDMLEISKNDEGKFDISAWILTHGHIDHIGTFLRFAEKYSDRINLAYLMYDFPEGYVAPNDANLPYFHATIDKYYPDTLHIDPHAGISYYFDNLCLRMLYTPELIYDKDNPLEYYNNTSLIFVAECNESRILHTVDAGEDAAELTWKSYEKQAFKSNAVQISHHGLGTGIDSGDWEYLGKIYEATESSVGLLPMGTRNHNEERNGRYALLITSSEFNFQLDFVTNKNDRHNLSSISQDYYDNFTKGVISGTSKYNTLFGYNGINIIVNENNMVTYVSCSESTEMISLFRMSEDGLVLIKNQELEYWINKQ